MSARIRITFFCLLVDKNSEFRRTGDTISKVDFHRNDQLTVRFKI